MKSTLVLIIAAAAALFLTGAGTAETVTIELPAETAAYKPGKDVEQAQAFCITCHSADYTASQPVMPRRFWEATVIKMKEKFGAPLPPDITPLVDYLTATYGKP